jgi:hypothetical protein
LAFNPDRITTPFDHGIMTKARGVHSSGAGHLVKGPIAYEFG